MSQGHPLLFIAEKGVSTTIRVKPAKQRVVTGEDGWPTAVFAEIERNIVMSNSARVALAALALALNMGAAVLQPNPVSARFLGPSKPATRDSWGGSIFWVHGLLRYS